jgi:hypothetical protein
MNTNIFLAFLALISAMALGGWVKQRSRRTLSPEQKLVLMERLSPIKKYVPIALIPLLFLAYKSRLSWTLGGFAGVVLVIQAMRWILIRRISVTSAYFRASVFETSAVVVGDIAFVLLAFFMPPGV